MIEENERKREQEKKKAASVGYIYLFIHLLGGFHQHQQHNPHSYTLNLAHQLCC